MFFNQCYSTRKVRQFVADLIIDKNCKSFYDLSHQDKYIFSALLIEAAGPKSEHECLLESNDLDKIMVYIKESLIGNGEYEKSLAVLLKENAVNFYNDTMQAIFENGLENFDQERREWIDQAIKYGNPDEAYDRYRDGL